MAGRRRASGSSTRSRTVAGRLPTFLAALRNDRVDAPCLFDGPINGERFRGYVEQFLVPTLKPGDVVILDNLGSHKGKAVRQAIRAVGARLLFLPKYSPDLNPIEQVFAKFKTLLRKAAARTYDAISDASKAILARIPPGGMRRLSQKRRICVDPNADRSRREIWSVSRSPAPIAPSWTRRKRRPISLPDTRGISNTTRTGCCRTPFRKRRGGRTRGSCSRTWSRRRAARKY